MGGGLMQLVAYGAQDIYLTGNPQITFFKVVYRRHTNFSMEAIEQTWSGQSNGKDGRCTSTISRNGDLVHRMYLEVSGSTSSSNPGSSFIKSVELEIGGQLIDKQSGVWMETWAELTQENPDCRSGTVSGELFNARSDPWHRFRGSTPFQNMSGFGGVTNSNKDFDGRDVVYYVPLQFWFCRNVGLSLPLIALQYHEVKIILDHEIRSIFGENGRNKLYVDYIFLDTDERRRFAQVSHEYLIEQVQEQKLSDEKTNNLDFNHPVKELIWTSYTNGARKKERENFIGNLSEAIGDNVDKEAKDGLKLKSLFFIGEEQYIEDPYLDSPTETEKWEAAGKLDSTYTLKLNGHERFSARPSTYFSRTQVFEHHTGQGGINLWEDICKQGEDEANSSLGVIRNAHKKSDLSAAEQEEYEDDISYGGRTGTNPFPVINWAWPLKSSDSGRGTNVGHCSFKGFCGESLNDSICVYSFALKPEDHQPSGTCNFSRIDSAQLITDKPFLLGDLFSRNYEVIHNYVGVIFAVNYNVLRIMSGMGGLAYSN